MKLKKFRTLEEKINIGLKIFCFLLVLTIIVMGKSFAEYKQETEVTFINAKVRWPRADEINYNTNNNDSVTNVEQALNDLYGKLGK